MRCSYVTHAEPIKFENFVIDTIKQVRKFLHYLFHSIQIITAVQNNTFPAPPVDAYQMTGVAMEMMTVVTIQMKRAALRSSALNVNFDVWMELVSLVAGAVMG